MGIQWKKRREHQTQANDFMDRFIDGKIIDQAEMHDRMVVFQQLGLIVALPQKQNYRNTL